MSEPSSTRTEALRRARERAEIDRQIVDGCVRMPQTDEEVAWARAATHALVEDEPW